MVGLQTRCCCQGPLRCLLLFSFRWTFQSGRGGSCHRVCSVRASPSPTCEVEATKDKRITRILGITPPFDIREPTLVDSHMPTGSCHSPHSCLSSSSLAVASFTLITSLVSNSEVSYFTRKDSTGLKNLALHFYARPL